VTCRSRQHAEVAVTVDARWRHRSGGAVDQLQRRGGQRGRGAGTGPGFVVDEAIRIEFAQPLQGEQWPGAIAEQALASGAVGGFEPGRSACARTVRTQALPHGAQEQMQNRALQVGIPLHEVRPPPSGASCFWFLAIEASWRAIRSG